MKGRKILKGEKIYKFNQMIRYPLSIPPTAMAWERFTRIVLPVLIALLVVAMLFIPVRIAGSQVPQAQNGVLNLADWNGKQAFAVSGQWEFYWDCLLSDEQIKDNIRTPILVNAPDKWSHYEIDGVSLPVKGKATYRIHVTGVQAGQVYGVRIKDMRNVYRFYSEGILVAQNGNFGDNLSAPASAYRSQLAAFTPDVGSFDLVMQVSNIFYGTGGMIEPVMFGTYAQVAAFDRQPSNVITYAMAVQTVSCLFFFIFFLAQGSEKEALVLSILAAVILLRLMIIGDALFIMFPNISVAWLGRLFLLCTPWAEFLLLYFLYLTYDNLVPKCQVVLLFTYSLAASLFILFFTSDIKTIIHQTMNYILLMAMTLVTVHLVRAARQGRQGAPLLLFAMTITTLLISYGLFLPDRSTGYYLLDTSAFQYMIFVFAQMAVVAMRYRRVHELEIAHLKVQIRPHFIHNALTSIISISRNDPDRSRELLVNFSSYLRGFYDYERDELISFSQELELVYAYTALEQARFGEKLKVEYVIEVEDFLLPSLLLQPLVENAFVHGLREKDNGGTVIIYAHQVKNSRVRIGVRDDGIGFSEKNSQSRRGVGIENINRRLSQLYHTSLVFIVPQGGGCDVYFEIPFNEVTNNESVNY
ncbi:MAG: histidine kinase [Desulfitobacteriaceae bacterium]|nr:histidine kinase [Desulfitobacteriaceae bacterium]